MYIKGKFRWEIWFMVFAVFSLWALNGVRNNLENGGVGVCAGWSNSTTGYAYPKETPKGTVCCESIITGHRPVDLNSLQFGQNIRSEVCGEPYKEVGK